jgi:hypothetical protein
MPFISNGTTILDNGAFSVSLGSQILLSTQTASASASISFTTGIDSTYKAYKFVFVNMHPATNNVDFTFNMSTNSGSNYNVTKTTTFFWSKHFEDGTGADLSYRTGNDLAQSTAFQQITSNTGNGNDESCDGYLTLFNPSSTTYVKHFIGTSNNYLENNGTNNVFVAGYCNTTSAVNAIQFKFSSGNIDDGTIKMYGIKG